MREADRFSECALFRARTTRRIERYSARRFDCARTIAVGGGGGTVAAIGVKSYDNEMCRENLATIDTEN